MGKVDKPYKCHGAECKTICDMPGCDYNSYRMGAHNFYGPGANFEVNTLKPFTIVTQFITADGTDEGDLSEIRRFYVQDGKRIENSKATWSGLNNQSSLTDESFSLDKKVFGETKDSTAEFGGLKQMGEAIGRGMTLVLSLWDDGESHMHWLDSMDPVGGIGTSLASHADPARRKRETPATSGPSTPMLTWSTSISSTVRLARRPSSVLRVSRLPQRLPRERRQKRAFLQALPLASAASEVDSAGQVLRVSVGRAPINVRASVRGLGARPLPWVKSRSTGSSEGATTCSCRSCSASRQGTRTGSKKR